MLLPTFDTHKPVAVFFIIFRYSEAETSFPFGFATVNGSFSHILSLSCADADAVPLFFSVRVVRDLFESSPMTFMRYAQFEDIILVYDMLFCGIIMSFSFQPA